MILLGVGNADVTHMNRPETGSMSGSHVLIQSLNGICSRHLPVLLVHIVRAGAGIVSDPDTKVLNLQWAFLKDLGYCQIMYC